MERTRIKLEELKNKYLNNDLDVNSFRDVLDCFEKELKELKENYEKNQDTMCDKNLKILRDEIRSIPNKIIDLGVLLNKEQSNEKSETVNEVLNQKKQGSCTEYIFNHIPFVSKSSPKQNIIELYHFSPQNTITYLEPLKCFLNSSYIPPSAHGCDLSNCIFNLEQYTPHIKKPSITLFIIFFPASRTGNDSFKSELNSLLGRTNVIVVFILSGGKSKPIVPGDDFNGIPHISLQYYNGNKIKDSEQNKQQFNNLCKFITNYLKIN